MAWNTNKRRESNCSISDHPSRNTNRWNVASGVDREGLVDATSLVSHHEVSIRHGSRCCRIWPQDARDVECIAMPSVGEKIVDAIIAGKLMRVECSEDKDHGCVVVWSANVHEQISQIVKASTRGNRPGDKIHDIVASYGRLLFPWRGRWVMIAENWQIRLTDRRGFHNCSATGIG